MRRAAGLPHVDSQVVPWITLCCRSQSTRPILQISHHCPLEKKEVPIWNEEEALGQVSYKGRAKEECEWEEIKYIAQRLHTTRGQRAKGRLSSDQTQLAIAVVRRVRTPTAGLQDRDPRKVQRLGIDISPRDDHCTRGRSITHCSLGRCT